MRNAQDITDRLLAALGEFSTTTQVVPARRGTACVTAFEPAAVLEDDAIVLRKSAEDTLVVGYLAQDLDPQEYWSSADGLGEFREFRYAGDRDEFLAEIRGEGKVALVINRYRHGGVHYSVHGSRTYPDHRWDVAPSAVLVPCDEVQERYREAVRAAELLPSRQAADMAAQAAWRSLVEDSNRVLQDFSDWCNGEVYGVVSETWRWRSDAGLFERIEEDACWGFVGTDFARRALEERLAGYAAPGQAPGQASTPN